MARQGHRLTVFSYEPGQLSAAGLDAEIRDAREVTGGDPDLLELLKTKPSTVSNFFRVAGLMDGRGIWVDLDCLLLHPLPDDPYVFGKIESGRINGAILKLPAGSPALLEYDRICRERPIERVPAWLPFRRRVSRRIALELARITGGRLPNYPHGPIAVTHIADKHGLSRLAHAHEVFYPIDSSEAAMLIDPVDRMGERITPHAAHDLRAPLAWPRHQAVGRQASTRDELSRENSCPVRRGRDDPAHGPGCEPRQHLSRAGART